MKFLTFLWFALSKDLRLGYLDLFLIHWPVVSSVRRLLYIYSLNLPILRPFFVQAFKYVEFDPSARGWPDEGQSIVFISLFFYYQVILIE